MSIEKVKRNKQIWLSKMGYRKVFDTKPSRKPKTYRELSQKHNLSITYLQIIINGCRKKYQRKQK